jgi:hypothetical protein
VIGDAPETLLSSDNLVVTLEFNGDDLEEEDRLSSGFINEEGRREDSDDKDRLSRLNCILCLSSNADALFLRLSAVLYAALRYIEFLVGDSRLLEI